MHDTEIKGYVCMMDMPLDLSFFLISLSLATAILALYYLSPKVSDFNSDTSEGFAVVHIIRTLKQACPVQFSNKWRLLPLKWGPIRCWSKNVSFPALKNCIKLYGATCAVTCSSMYAFSLISNVSKWGEWEPSQSSQNLLLRPFDSNKFKKDHFMQADQIAGIQRGTNIQSYVAMYRFLSLPSKCTKWVLFWNAKKFEFMFFIIQPAACRSADVQCVVTHIYGSLQFSSYSATLVSQRVRNIKDFLSLSLLNVKPFGYSSSIVPIPPEPSPLRKRFTLEENPSPVFLEAATCDNSNAMFYLVPFFQSLLFTLKRLKGYNLVLKKIGDNIQPKKKASPPKKSKVNETLRRVVSDISIMTNSSYNSSHKPSFKSYLAPAFILNDLNKLPSEAIEAVEEYEVPDNEEVKELKTLTYRFKLRSFSDPDVQNNEKFKTSSPSELSENTSEEDDHKSLDSMSELEENTMMIEGDHIKNELFCSSTSDFEVLDTNQQFIDTRMADFLTQGNYGASVLQTEMMLASQFDRTLHAGNRVAGGWIHCSTYKGIPVLTKIISGKIMKILSFLCQIEIPVYYKDVWKCVKNPRFRFFSDETVKTVQIVDRISETQKLIHIYHEISGLLRKEAVDFCLLQTEREEKNHLYSVFQSIEYERCPFMTSVTRGVLKPSGWIVQNLTPKSCKVTYLVQILVSSPDSLYIQELSSLIPQSLLNLKHYITSRPM